MYEEAGEYEKYLSRFDRAQILHVRNTKIFRFNKIIEFDSISNEKKVWKLI